MLRCFLYKLSGSILLDFLLNEITCTDRIYVSYCNCIINLYLYSTGEDWSILHKKT